jgi:hypothetical protein
MDDVSCQHMKTYEEVKVRLHALLTSTEDERECSAIRSFTPSSGTSVPVVIGEGAKWIPEPVCVLRR